MSNQNVPELRLDGFEGEWERQNVASISKLVTRVTPSSTAPVMMISAASGFIPQSNKYSSDNAGKSLGKYIELHQDELAYNHGASKLRQFGSCFKLDVPAARVPFVYHCFQVLEDDPTFVGFSLNRDSVQEQLRRLVSSGARMDGLLNISFEQYGTVEVSLPPTLEEQQAIGVVFTNLDAAIDQHTDKHRVLQRTKTALMQKMFPQDGQTEPDLRLDGFEGKWDSVTLGDVGKLHTGYGFPESQQNGVNGIPFYKVSDMNLLGNEREMLRANHYVESDQITRQGWRPVFDVPAILFAKVGAAIFLGRKRLVRSPFLMDNNMMAYSIEEGEWVTSFAQTVFDHLDLSTLVQTGSLPSINPSAVKALEVKTPPTVEEQRAIGAVFTKLDSLISAEAQFIEKLKQTKTALLQKMFV